jgi:hypothetical protein
VLAVAPTSGAELVAVAFGSLAALEQGEAYARIVDVRLTRLSLEENERAVYIAALRQVAEATAGDLSPDSYRATQRHLATYGTELPDFNRICRYFGSWRLAKEAVGLAETTTAEKIEARFRSRLVGRQRTFTLEETETALRRCVADLGRVPLVAEYSEWRLKELALARTRGEAARIPSASVYRRRHDTWEAALLACGYSVEEVYVRLEPKPERRHRLAKVDRYSEQTLRDTLLRCARDLGRLPVVEEFEDWRRRELARTRAFEVVLPSDSPYRRRYGSWEGALRHFGFSDDEVAARLHPGRERSRRSLERQARF